jgi:hypothetical protein
MVRSHDEDATGGSHGIHEETRTIESAYTESPRTFRKFNCDA